MVGLGSATCDLCNSVALLLTKRQDGAGNPLDFLQKAWKILKDLSLSGLAIIHPWFQTTF